DGRTPRTGPQFADQVLERFRDCHRMSAPANRGKILQPRRAGSQQPWLSTRPGAPGASCLARQAHLFHERPPVGLLRRVLGVRMTKQPDQVGIMDVGPSKALEVIELEASGLGTPATVLVDES